MTRVAGKSFDTLGMKTGLSHMEWFSEDGSIAISSSRPPGAQFPITVFKGL
jgi:hypothetical protein